MSLWLKRIGIGLLVIVVGLALVEVVNLLQLKGSVGRYAAYWKQRSNSSGEFTYVAVGDSTAQGIGASKPEYGYVGLLAEHIAKQTGKKVRVVNLSITGATVQDAIEVLVPEIEQYQPNLVTLEIGANDVTMWDQAAFTARYDKLITMMPAGTIVGNIPYFGGRIRNNAQAITASGIIAQAAASRQFKLVDLQTATRTQNSLRNYAADAFHPSNHAYQIWEAAFWPSVEQTISSANQ